MAYNMRTEDRMKYQKQVMLQAKTSVKQGHKRQFDRTSDSASDRRSRKRDFSKVQYFTCDKYGHTTKDCPERARRHHASTANEEEIQPQKKHDPRDFFFKYLIL